MSLAGKRLLVTGAGGFIGSHLAEALVAAGAHVRAFVHYNALGSMGWLDHSDHAADMEVVAGDISDRDSVRSAMEDCEIVFHLAALIGIPYSYVAPVSYVRVNVEGTLNILQGARELGVSRVLCTSTSEVYGTAQSVPISENHRLQGQSPYSATKISADKIAEAFHLSYEVPVVTVRPFNTFGPRQSQRAVIPTIISQCLESDVIRLGSAYPTRDLNFVSDTVSGFMQAAMADSILGEVINLGTGKEIAIGDLARLIADLMDREIEIVSEEARVRPTGSEVERLVADSSKARELLGWEPRVELREGLKRTVDWIRANSRFYHSGAYRV